jgi:hypothetical protein
MPPRSLANEDSSFLKEESLAIYLIEGLGEVDGVSMSILLIKAGDENL